jgi:peptide/nickel transport system substrate-binding protein
MRKLAVGSLILVLVTCGWGTHGVGQQVPAPRGELRIVDKHPLNWVWIVFNVFEHLIELDKDGKMVPGLATSWRWLDERTLEFILRQGVKFHNGEVFDAEIVRLNWEENTRLQQPFGTGPYRLVEGVSTPEKRSDQLVLEANLDYWDTTRFPRVQRIIFDNTLDQKAAVELVKTGEGRVDVVTGLSPLDTLRVAQSPFAKVVKTRGMLGTVFGMFNMRKTGSPWRDMRLRQAVNLAINRDDLIRYAAKGNGLVVPALVPVQGFGYDPDLTPYPFDADKTRHLLRQAGYPEGLSLTLIATEDLAIQATVVSKMLEHAGFRAALQILDPTAYNRQTVFSYLDQPVEQQPWDIALKATSDILNSPAYLLYTNHVLDGYADWVLE